MSISSAAAISGVEGVQTDMTVNFCTGGDKKDYDVADFYIDSGKKSGANYVHFGQRVIPTYLPN